MKLQTTVLQEDIRILRFTMGGGVFDGADAADHSNDWNVVNLLVNQVNVETVSTILGAQRIIIDVGFSSVESWRQALKNVGILDVLESVQDVVKVVVPLYSLHQLAVAGEIPYWESERKYQNNQVLGWSGVFPGASLIFLLDPILPNGSPLALLYQSIESEIVYAPDVSGGLLGLDEAAEILDAELFRPNDGSVVIQAQPTHLPSAAQEAVQLYRAMYALQPRVQAVAAALGALIPFSTRISEVQSSVTAQARKLVSILPPPTDFRYIEENRQLWESRKYTTDQTELPLTAPIQQVRVAPDQTVMTSPDDDLDDSPEVDIVADPVWQEESTQSESPTESLSHAKPTTNAELPSDTKSPTYAVFETKPTEVIEVQPLTHQPAVIMNDESINTRIQEKTTNQLSSDVKRIFRSNIEQTKVQTTTKKVAQRKKIRQQSKKRQALFYIGVIFVSIGLGLGALLGWFQFSVGRAQAELSRVLADSAITPTKTQVSWGSFQTQVAVLKPVHAFFNSILALGVVGSAEDLIQTADMLASLEKSTLSANQSVISVFKSIWTNTGGSVGELSKTMVSELTVHHKNLQEFSQVVQLGEEEHILGLSTNDTSEKSAILLEKIIPQLGAIFGEGGSKNYVVVLQNSQELRPTGGFIEAVALLSFADGSISGVETYSSYQLDSRIQKHITPPEDLQQILGEQQWWLRDANWFPDGPKTADEIARFAHSTIGKKPDGVIILNTLSLPAILAATGPIEMPEFNEVLTDKNIAERLEFHTELPHQVVEAKTEYRGALLKALFAKLGQLSDEQTLAFLDVIHRELDNRQLLLYSVDPDIQQSFAQFGWVGSFAFPSCPAPFNEHHCETDGIAQIETNVGVNRANAYIERAVTHNIALTPEGATHVHSITWENRAQVPAWPKGDYRVYLRLYVPRQVSSVSATLDGKPVAQQEIRRVSSQNSEEIGLVVVVPVKEKATLAVTYTTPLSLTADPSSYLFYQVRQPGTTTNLAPVTINHPESWHVSTVAPEPESLSPALVFGSQSAPHMVQIVQFTQAK